MPPQLCLLLNRRPEKERESPVFAFDVAQKPFHETEPGGKEHLRGCAFATEPHPERGKCPQELRMPFPLFGKERFYYWRLVFWFLIRKPGLLPIAVTFSIYGFHFRKILKRHFRRMEKENWGQTRASAPRRNSPPSPAAWQTCA